MSNEELKQNLTSSNQWIRLIYMVLFAVLLEIAGFVMLAVVIAQFLFAIFSGGANDNLRRLGDQLASFIYQTLQFLIYNTEEKPFPFSEWPESQNEDLSSYESAEEIDGEIISAEASAGGEVAEEVKPLATKPRKTRKAKKPEKTEEETVIELGADTSAETVSETGARADVSVAKKAAAKKKTPANKTQAKTKPKAKPATDTAVAGDIETAQDSTAEKSSDDK